MTQLEKTKDRIKEIIQTRNESAAAASAKSDAMADELKKYVAKMDVASISGDTEAFSAAKAAYDKIAADMQTFSEFASRDKGLPMITDKEYSELVTLTIAECQNTIDEAKRKMLSLVDKIEEIGAEVAAVIADTNNTLISLERDVYQNRDRIRVLANGKSTIAPGTEKSFKDRSAMNFAYKVANDFCVTQWKKELLDG